jgi:DNA-binding winged helix-turn-helix (wHTH) protein/Tol biopolymer transport system component
MVEPGAASGETDGGVIDPARAFLVGPWEARAATNEIVRGETTLRLEPKVMRLLVLLAGRSGQVVSRAAIVEALWEGRAVTDDAVNRQIAKLRQALGDDPRHSVFIRTIPRSGLQLIAPVIQGGRTLAEPRPSRMGARRVGLAVAVALALTVAGAAWLMLGGQARLGPETRLTSDPGAETSPALSPDGRWLAYIGGEAGRRLLVRDIDTPRAQPLGPAGADLASPAWSPSGLQLAFIQTAPGCAVSVGSPSALTSRVVWNCVGWTPGRLTWRDDTHLVISASHDHAPYQLLQLDLKSGGVRPLSRPPAAGLGDVLPLWVEARRRLYFVRLHQGGQADGDIFALDPRSGKTTQLTHTGGRFNAIAPGGGRALTVSATGGESLFRLWRVDLGSGRLRPLTGAGDFIGLAAAADGGRLVYGKASGSISLVLADTADARPEQVLTTSTAIDFQPAICGADLAFLSSRAGTVQLWAGPLSAASRATQLTRVKGALVEFACSRDGGLYALGVNRAGRYQLIVFNRRIGRTDAVAEAAHGLHAPTFSAAADAVFFVRARDGGQVLVRRDLASNSETTVARDVIRALASADNRSVYFARSDRQSLWRLDLANGTTHRLATLPTRFSPADFVLGDGALWVLGRPEPSQGAPLYRVDPDGGEVTLARRLPELFGENFGLAAGGGRLIYPRLDRLDVDLYRADVARARPWEIRRP